jgi:hypothetical protein
MSLGPAPVSRLVDMVEKRVYVCDDVNRGARKWDGMKCRRWCVVVGGELATMYGTEGS